MLRRTTINTYRLATTHSRLFSSASPLLRSLLPSGSHALQLIRTELKAILPDEKPITIKPFKQGTFYWNASFAINVKGEDKFVAHLVNMDNQNNIPFSLLASQYQVFPKIYYHNLQVSGGNNTGIAIRDYIKDFDFKKNLMTGALTSTGALIRKFATMNTPSHISSKESTIFEHYYQLAQQKMSDPVIQKILIRYNQLKEKIDSFPNCVLHGDLHPDNVLFDGERSWLLDLEFTRKASALAPLIDIATLSFSLDVQQEKELLKATCGALNRDLLVKYLEAKEIARLRSCFITIGLRENYLNSMKNSEDAVFSLEKYKNYTRQIESFYDLSVKDRIACEQAQNGGEHPLLSDMSDNVEKDISSFLRMRRC